MGSLLASHPIRLSHLPSACSICERKRPNVALDNGADRGVQFLQKHRRRCRIDPKCCTMRPNRVPNGFHHYQWKRIRLGFFSHKLERWRRSTKRFCVRNALFGRWTRHKPTHHYVGKGRDRTFHCRLEPIRHEPLPTRLLQKHSRRTTELRLSQ